MKIKEGQIIAFTEGEYADFTVQFHAKALRAFDKNEVLRAFMATDDYRPEWKGRQAPGDDTAAFVVYLEEEGFIEKLVEDEILFWHLGEYSRLEVPEDDQ